MATLLLALFCSVGQSPTPALDAHLKQLEAKDVQTRRDGAENLNFLFHNHVDLPGEKVTRPLLKALRDPDAEVRWQVVCVFCKFNQAYKPAIPILAGMLRDDKDVDTRAEAAYALLKFASAAKDELPTLKEAKKQDDKHVRLYAGGAVARLEPEDENALRFVLQFLKDGDKDVRSSALDVFTFLGVRTIPALKGGLNDKNTEVRVWTIKAIMATRAYRSEDAKFPLDVIPLLIKAIDDEDRGVAYQAIYAVELLGPRGKGAIPALVRRFKDPKWQMRYTAIDSLEAFGSASDAATPGLKEALKDEHESVRTAAERALRSIDEAKKKPARRKRPRSHRNRSGRIGWLLSGTTRSTLSHPAARPGVRVGGRANAALVFNTSVGKNARRSWSPRRPVELHRNK